MSSFQISRDKDGKPVHVTHDTDFPAIQAGRDMEFLVQEVNRLRRALWSGGQESDIYRKAAGF